MNEVCVIQSIQNVIVQNLNVRVRIRGSEDQTASVMKAKLAQRVLDEVDVLLKDLLDFFFTMFDQVDFGADNCRRYEKIGYEHSFRQIYLFSELIHHFCIVVNTRIWVHHCALIQSVFLLIGGHLTYFLVD